MNRYIWSNSFILSINQHPKSEISFRYFEILSNALLEGMECFGFEDSESREFRSRKIFIVERGEVEPLMSSKSVVGDDFGGKIKMLLVPLSSLCLQLFSFRIQSRF